MVIGITGRIGSGKTEIARIFKRNGFKIIDVDQMGHNLLRNEEIKKNIKETYGDYPFTKRGIDRKKLSKIVFRDKRTLYGFNAIMHPPLIRELRSIVENQPDTSHLVVDCALIFEWGIEKLFDSIILVKCNEEKIIERMVKTGRTEDEVRRILSVQLPDEEKLDKADFVIENNGDLSQLEKKTTDMIKDSLIQTSHKGKTECR